MIRLGCDLSNAFLSRGQACHDNNERSGTPAPIPNANSMGNPAKAISSDMASST
jgi:hypothetical protein